LAWADPPAAISVEHAGEPGLWLPRDMAQQVLADVEELRVRRTELQLCKARSDLRAERAEELEKALGASKKSATTSKKALDAAIRGREQAKRDSEGWFAGKPLVWGLVGALVGGVGTALAVHYIVR
jgi:hypothetical protein